MKLYVLVAKTEDGDVTFNMPTNLGRAVRAYKSEGIALTMAKKFKCHVVELHVGDGTLIK